MYRLGNVHTQSGVGHVYLGVGSLEWVLWRRGADLGGDGPFGGPPGVTIEGTALILAAIAHCAIDMPG